MVLLLLVFRIPSPYNRGRLQPNQPTSNCLHRLFPLSATNHYLLNLFFFYFSITCSFLVTIQRSSSMKRKISSTDEDGGVKILRSPKQRVIGPALPPQPSASDQEKAEGDCLSETDSDDNFGPKLPSDYQQSTPLARQPDHLLDRCEEEQDRRRQGRRDEWMLQPPEESDWVTRIDPTRLRSRKFQSGKSARTTSSKGADPTWSETPERRMQRLRDEVLGVGPSSGASETQSSINNKARAKSTAEKIQNFKVRL